MQLETKKLLEDIRGVADRTLNEYAGQISRCVRLLDTEQVWARVNENCNSVGNLLLHLQGNLRQWIVSGLGGTAMDRDRPAEFAQRGPVPTDKLLAALTETVAAARTTIANADTAALAKRYSIQQREVSGTRAVFHAVEHFAFHTGQIIQITKELRNVGLSLYDEHGQRLTP
ncbi:MAG: DUF1572 family protein [Planctomycetes bacterium]|nr:DUF1572 family protein [Planctomycetota bacterium]